MSKLQERLTKFRNQSVKQIQAFSRSLSDSLLKQLSLQFVAILDSEIMRVKDEISDQIVRISEGINDDKGLTIEELKQLKGELLLLAKEIVQEQEELTSDSIKTINNFNASVGQVNTGNVNVEGDNIGSQEQS